MNTVYLPPATGSGKQYAASNVSGDTVGVALTDAADSLDGVVDGTFNLEDTEGLKVVDYKADNWVII